MYFIVLIFSKTFKFYNASQRHMNWLDFGTQSNSHNSLSTLFEICISSRDNNKGKNISLNQERLLLSNIDSVFGFKCQSTCYTWKLINTDSIFDIPP